MRIVHSADGTAIAFDRTGEGPMVILVAGAFSHRLYPGLMQLARLLAPRFTVINYDRRGRGDSEDTKPYSVQREIEDLEALVQEAGGLPHVWGMSSGAVLALKAAAHGVNIKKLALYEPPFVIDDSGSAPPKDFVAHVSQLIAAGDRAGAIKYFMTKGMGAPAMVVLMMRLMPGVWRKLMAVAHTLPYDAKLMEGNVAGRPLQPAEWASVSAPVLVMHGGKSPASLRHAAEALAGVLPNAQQRTLEGLSHKKVSMNVMAPVLDEFFAA